MASIPILDLSDANDLTKRKELLDQLHHALLHVGFLYAKNHGVPQTTIDDLINILPRLFNLPTSDKLAVSKLNSPHFLGYNEYAEESTLGQQDLRDQFDFATELPIVYDSDFADKDGQGRDFSKQYWRLRGPNQWPDENVLPDFREILTRYDSMLLREMRGYLDVWS